LGKRKNQSRSNYFLLYLVIGVVFWFTYLSTPIFSFDCSYNNQNYVVDNITYFCPSINYNFMTDYNGTNIFNRTNLIINVSVTKGSFPISNITTNIYNSSFDLINSTFSNQNNSHITYQIPNYGFFYYNTTTYDLNNSLSSKISRVGFFLINISFTNDTLSNGSVVNNSVYINVGVISNSNFQINNVTIDMYNISDWYNRTEPLVISSNSSHSFNAVLTNYEDNYVMIGGYSPLFESYDGGDSWNERSDLNFIYCVDQPIIGGNTKCNHWKQFYSPKKQMNNIIIIIEPDCGGDMGYPFALTNGYI